MTGCFPAPAPEQASPRLSWGGRAACGCSSESWAGAQPPAGFPAPCSPRVASEPVGAHETLEGVAALQKCPERCQPALLVPGVPAAQVSLPRLAAGPQRQACGAGEPGSPAHASRGPRPCSARRCLRTSSDPPLRAPHSWRGRGATSAGAQREVALPAP